MRKLPLLVAIALSVALCRAQTVNPGGGGTGGGGTGCVPAGTANRVVTSDGAGGCQITTLPLTGSTLGGNLLFTDASFDIGASGATRPRNIFLSGNGTVGGTLAVTGHTTFEGVTSTGATGTGKLVYDASPTFTGTPVLPTPFTLGAISVTSTGTQLNYLAAASGTTGTTSTNVVFSTSPTLVTPTLGVASATTVNKVTITAPATGATLTIPDGTTINTGAGGTLGSNAFTSTAYTPTSRSISTTTPLGGGGDLTSDRTFTCTTCVVASSPGAGIAHFAGSTQTVTSSAVVNADITSIDGATKITGVIPNSNLPTLTYTPSVFGGANLIPDSSGNVFMEPYTILSGTAFFAYNIMAFADTSTSDCAFTRFNVPINYTTGATTWIIDWTTTATSGNAIWTLDYRDVSTATLAATTSQESLTVTTAASGTASARTQSTMTATASNFSAGDIIQIRFCRNGAGSDTIAATLAIHDVRFSYVGRP